MKYGEKIKDARIKKGWQQSELARAIGVSQTMVSKYEKSIRYPSKGITLNIKIVLGVNDFDNKIRMKK